jgi:acyl-CoA hydrolase
MVAIDEKNNPASVPGLILENLEETRRFYHAFRRKELKKMYRDEAANIITPMAMPEYLELLSDERCVIAL